MCPATVHGNQIAAAAERASKARLDVIQEQIKRMLDELTVKHALVIDQIGEPYRQLLGQPQDGAGA